MRAKRTPRVPKILLFADRSEKDQRSLITRTDQCSLTVRTGRALAELADFLSFAEEGPGLRPGIFRALRSRAVRGP